MKGVNIQRRSDSSVAGRLCRSSPVCGVVQAPVRHYDKVVTRLFSATRMLERMDSNDRCVLRAT